MKIKSLILASLLSSSAFANVETLKDETRDTILRNRDKIENYEMFLKLLNENKFEVIYDGGMSGETDGCRTYPKCVKMRGPEVCTEYEAPSHACPNNTPNCTIIKKRCYTPTINVCRDYTTCD